MEATAELMISMGYNRELICSAYKQIIADKEEAKKQKNRITSKARHYRAKEELREMVSTLFPNDQIMKWTVENVKEKKQAPCHFPYCNHTAIRRIDVYYAYEHVWKTFCLKHYNAANDVLTKRP